MAEPEPPRPTGTIPEDDDELLESSDEPIPLEDPNKPGAPRLRNHRASPFAHAPETHLGQKIEIVLIQEQNLRAQAFERGRVLLETSGHHRIEERHVMACRANARRQDRDGTPPANPSPAPSRSPNIPRLPAISHRAARVRLELVGATDSIPIMVIFSAAGSTWKSWPAGWPNARV